MGENAEASVKTIRGVADPEEAIFSHYSFVEFKSSWLVVTWIDKEIMASRLLKVIVGILPSAVIPAENTKEVKI